MINLFTSSEIFTIQEVSEILKMPVATLRDKVFRNQIPYIKLGEGKKAGIRFYGQQLNQWLTENQGGWKSINEPLPEHNQKIRKAQKNVVKNFNEFLEKIDNKRYNEV